MPFCIEAWLWCLPNFRVVGQLWGPLRKCHRAHVCGFYPESTLAAQNSHTRPLCRAATAVRSGDFQFACILR